MENTKFAERAEQFLMFFHLIVTTQLHFKHGINGKGGISRTIPNNTDLFLLTIFY
jgi:hypothetical protein